MPTLAKKNLPESMAKSTLPEVLTLKLPEDGKSISVLPVALLGRDSDGDGVLIFGDSDGYLQVQVAKNLDTQQTSSGEDTIAPETNSMNISLYNIGSVEIASLITGGSSVNIDVKAKVSNDGTNFVVGSTSVNFDHELETTVRKVSQIAAADMAFKYIKWIFVVSGGTFDTNDWTLDNTFKY